MSKCIINIYGLFFDKHYCDIVDQIEDKINLNVPLGKLVWQQNKKVDKNIVKRKQWDDIILYKSQEGKFKRRSSTKTK